MKIAFINISLRPDAKRRQIPVGLGYILTAVKRAGFDFDLIDMDIDRISMEDLAKILEDKKYDIFAFGTIVSAYLTVKNVAKVCKDSNPNSIIVVGNSVASAIHEILLNNTAADIAVFGEGDYIMVNILEGLKNGVPLENIKGIAFKENNKIIKTPELPFENNIDNLGFPDWELFNLEKYFSEDSSINTNSFVVTDEKIRWLPINTGRGCPYGCTFCYITVRNDEKRYRRYSEECILEEIKRLHYKYGVNYMRFWDDLTFPNRNSVRKMIKLFKNLDFKFHWDGPVRGDLFGFKDMELLKEVRDSGCDNLGFSLENADEEILAAIDKKLDVDKFVEQCKVLHEVGITPLTSVIFGYPQETPETIQKTLDVCEEAGVYPSVGYLLPLPGTKIYQWAIDNGKIKDEVAFLESIGDRQDFHVNLTNMSDEEFKYEATTRLQKLAEKQNIGVDNVMKTGRYRKPQNDCKKNI